MAIHKDTILAASVTSTTKAEAGTLSIPSGKGGVLISVEAVIFPVAETVVNSGGLVTLTNGSLDWVPFEFLTKTVSSKTLGGANLSKTQIMCRKVLPADSIITASYTPFDDQAQVLALTFTWDDKLSVSGKQTFSLGSLGTAITQATIKKDHNTIKIPVGKEGKIDRMQTLVLGSLETVLSSGGKVDLFNNASDPSILPLSFYVGGATLVGTGGFEQQPTMEEGLDLDAKGNSTFTADYTPQDDQSQLLAIVLFWEK